jgi:hypothetical protein
LVDPELMIRMLIVGYCFGIRSRRRPARGGSPQSGISVVLPTWTRWPRAGALHFLQEPAWSLSKSVAASSTTLPGEKAFLFRHAVLAFVEGLLMTPRRTATDGFFVSVLGRVADN